MFPIKTLRLGNFAFYQAQDFPFDGERTLIGGANGSGKSTLVDAFRLALGSERTFHKKKQDGYLRPDNAWHVVAVIAYNKTASGRAGVFYKLGKRAPLVTLARVYVPKGGASYESRFFIEDGELDIPDLLRLAKDGKGFGLYAYLGHLQQIGITPDRLENLIVKQGTVQLITDQNPQQLYRQVMQAAGATPTVKQYDEARKQASEAWKTLDRSQTEVNLQESVLKGHRATLETRRRYDALQLDIVAYQTEAIASEAQGERYRMREAERAMNTAHGEKTKLAAQQKADQLELPELKLRHDQLFEVLARIDLDAEARNRRVTEATEASLQAAQDKQRLKDANKAIRAAKGLPDVEALAERRDSAKAARDAAFLAANKARQEYAEADAALSAAREGRRHLPAPVLATLRALDDAGIQHEVLAGLVDVESKSQTRLEHALGHLRYALLVKPKDHERAVEIARKAQHPGPVHAGALTLPAWASDFKTEKATVTSSHGTWVAEAAPPFALGKLGSKAHVAAAVQAEAQARKALDAAESTLQKADEAVQSAESDLERGEAASDAGKLLAKAPAIEKAYEDAQAALLALKTRPGAESRTLLQDRVNAAKGSLDAVQSAINARATKIGELDDEYDKAKGRYAAAEANVPRLEVQLSAEWRERAANLVEALREVKTLRTLIKQREQDMSHIVPVPPADIADVVSKMERSVAILRNNLSTIREQHEKAREQLEAARKLYAQFCNQHAEAYCKKVQEWAKAFAIDAKADYTPIRDDSAEDLIDTAELSVSAGFDGKKRSLVHGGGFSGGQRVLLGIVMRLAMTKAEQDSFFIVDQPYDELDTINTMLMAEHLRNAPLHVIIVVPNSESPSQYHGIVRGIKLNKAPGDGPNDWAPPPIVVGVRQEAKALAA